MLHNKQPTMLTRRQSLGKRTITTTTTNSSNGSVQQHSQKSVVAKSVLAAASTKDKAVAARKRKALGDVSNQVNQNANENNGGVAVKKEKLVSATSTTSVNQISKARAQKKADENIAPKAQVQTQKSVTVVKESTVKVTVEEQPGRVLRSQAKQVEPEQQQQQKKKVKEAAAVPEEPIQDLDTIDIDDPMMAYEYSHEIFEYLRELEVKTMPDADYISAQKDLKWNMRSILIDWLVEVHQKFRLLPETLFLTINLLDRFLSVRAVKVSKLQLVGVTAMFIASKYEEVYAPSINQFVYITDGGYSNEEILKAERFMLASLDFGLHYPNPLHFLRRCSKADDYDTCSRTMAKYFLEVCSLHEEFLPYTPSLCAAAGMYIARNVFGKKEWNATMRFYSGYSVEEMMPVVKRLVKRLRQEPKFTAISSKYAGVKYSRVSKHVELWIKKDENVKTLGYGY